MLPFAPYLSSSRCSRRFRAINAPRFFRFAHRRAVRPGVGSFHFLPLSRLLLPACGLLLPLSLAQGQHVTPRHKATLTAEKEKRRKGEKERAAETAQTTRDEEADEGTIAGQGTQDNAPGQIPTQGQELPRPGDSPNTPAIKAVSAILIDAVSGQVLYEKNADQPRPMASTTKIMTALLLCEHVPDENTLIKASKLASMTRESSLHLKMGEKISAHDLLRAILMRSANDACVAAAEHVGGSVSGFADLMNARAQQLGCTHTHFVNPHGLQNKLHYTSARDLALIARQAIQQPRISEVTQLRKCRIARSMDKFDVTMRNHSHKFLEKYPGADGIKTGWTVPAGHCFVGSATRGGWRLIAVVLKSPDFVQETSALMNYGFSHFERRGLTTAGYKVGACPVQNGVMPSVPTATKQAMQVIVPRTPLTPPTAIQTRMVTRPQMAPVRAGAEVGMIEEQLNGVTVCTTPLIATASVPAAAAPALLIKSKRSSKSLLLLTSIFVAVVVSLKYGKGFTTTTKNARRRWRRLKKSMRGSYR